MLYKPAKRSKLSIKRSFETTFMILTRKNNKLIMNVWMRLLIQHLP